MNIESHIHSLLIQTNDLALLKGLVDMIRPPRRKKLVAEETIKSLCTCIENDENLRQRIKTAITNTITKADLQYIFSDSGLVTGSGFFAELRQKIIEKILPTLLPENDLRIQVRKIFSKRWDYKWVNLLDPQIWVDLFRSIQMDVSFENDAQMNQLLLAAEKLSYCIAALSLDKKMMQQANGSGRHFNAFIEQNKAWQHYSEAFKNNDSQIKETSFQQLMYLLDKSLEQIKIIRKATQETGTSLQQTFIIERIRQQLLRLQIIITIIDPSADVSTMAYSEYFKEVVESENTHNRVRSFLSSNFSFLAYQIAEHGSRTGEKYITNNLKEYGQFIKAAAIGGVIISVAALVKLMLGFVPSAPFWQSFLFGLNYALAFLVIHLFRGSIATKQPALTASAIATSLDNTNPRSPSLNNLALTVGKVFRSQLASLFGNLVIVFPLTMLIAFLYYKIAGSHLVNEVKVEHILHDVQPSIRNIWFAGVAAFLLFMSGIVSGYFDNMVIYGKIPERVRVNTNIRNLFGAKKTIRLALYIDKNLGALMGNIFLGFGLGFMMFFGHIFGIPLDIRHVTISSGFFSFAAVANGFSFTLSQWLFYILGLLLIATTNLLVSFSMALYVAMKSRKVSGTQLIPLLKISGRYFLRFPGDFVFPPKKERLPQELATGK